MSKEKIGQHNGFSLDELLCAMMKEMDVLKVPDGSDMPLTIVSQFDEFHVADFSICKLDGKFYAMIEMGEKK